MDSFIPRLYRTSVPVGFSCQPVRALGFGNCPLSEWRKDRDLNGYLYHLGVSLSCAYTIVTQGN